MMVNLFSALFFAFVGAGVGVLLGIVLVVLLGNSIASPEDAVLLFLDPDKFERDMKRNLEYLQQIIITTMLFGSILGLIAGWNIMHTRK